MKNNKGFSLVELIIVIAIMAILVGVMAPQLIKYIEKSNVSSDAQLCDTIRSAITTSMSDSEVVLASDYKGISDGQSYTVATLETAGGSTFTKAFEEALGCTKTDIAKQVKSQPVKGTDAFIIAISGSQIQVYLNGSCASGKKGNDGCKKAISAGPEIVNPVGKGK